MPINKSETKTKQYKNFLLIKIEKQNEHRSNIDPVKTTEATGDE